MLEKSVAIGKAAGKGEWQKIIDLAEKDDYLLLAFAYEGLKDTENAKKYYHLALKENQNNLDALKQISMIYALEENYDEAYKYILRALDLVKYENNYSIKIIAMFIDVLKKILHPSYSFKKMRKMTKEDIESINDWIVWAMEYKHWYEKYIQK